MRTKYDVDVCVIGGGAAGIAAAVGAANMGSNVLLVERNPYCGGQATNSNVTAYCGFFTRGENPDAAVKGIGEIVLERLRSYGEKAIPFHSKATGNISIRFDPEKIKLVFDDLIIESGVKYLLHTAVIDVNVEGGKITSIVCMDDEEKYRVKAKSFVDCTGDANIVHMAGLETMWGNESGKTQMSSLSVRVDQLPMSEEINPKDLTNAIIDGKKEGVPYLYKEKGLIVKIPDENYGFITIPSVFVEDLSGETLTKKEVNLRKQAQSYVSLFKEKIPYLKDIRIVSTGPAIGIRESRRMIGDAILTYEDVMSLKKPEDSVARGSWSPEVHKDEKNYDFHYLPDNEYFGIPLSVLHSKDISNLWAAGRLISCDAFSHASIRVMGTGFATGHAAGVAAALQCDDELSVENVQRELIRQNALI